MEIKDFRIGNNVFFDGKVQEISSVHSYNTIRLKENKDSKCHGCYKVNRIKPIPLTEEVLLSCGFEKNDLDEYEKTFKKSRSIIVKSDDFDSIRYVDRSLSLVVEPSDFSLHKLQNLIHALTGEELTYNHS